MRATVALLMAAALCLTRVDAFSSIGASQLAGQTIRSQPATVLYLASEHADDNEIVAKRIFVKGDVQGGYYRSCVLNEVRGMN